MRSFTFSVHPDPSRAAARKYSEISSVVLGCYGHRQLGRSILRSGGRVPIRAASKTKALVCMDLCAH